MEKKQQKIARQEVTIDSKVLVRFPSGEIVPYTIVDPNRMDPNHGIISCDSPLGKALLGNKKGAEVIYTVENRVIRVSIVYVYPKTKNT